ncbi:hypothetical protein EOA75_04500 [Mesorhizobium sp. M1A.F.Ca.IN.022.07.1.1]|uniref:hypothetical protein n=1 Tax=unclassified Mesorhizobium TaxID=325217 RepID=UPI000F75B92E|nr:MULTISPECIES: hypothetical protein [unclassified Mesorhizobium]TGV92090.1 hypothetical protein EN801_014350 [Mesorhizobium sp. M00.F.Ca.ET.158.01.1.1]AZO58483.1 hypothetical protein EJ078_03515 [Mesorhizobium sp. M1A.F.Ca.IN.022.06.1.1]MCT2579416.1 hypothetical protein [Mesorhizobium sp. P13.3]MDF3168409.1 hypothetical protein [Mesorhizobium sp. P16.1]MDF3178009.1 hypothetical protein [Mesorhizobium sp. P17.1]
MPQIGDRLSAGIAHFCLASGLGGGSDLAQHRIVVVRKFACDSLNDLEILLPDLGIDVGGGHRLGRLRHRLMVISAAAEHRW